VVANIQHLATELMRKSCNSIQMLMLMSQRLRDRKLAWMEVGRNLVEWFLIARVLGGQLAMVGEELFEVFGAEEGDFGEEKFTLN
jgi:hypothetical protein